MAVAHDASSQSAYSASVASFNWTHTPVGTPRAAVVFVMSYGVSTGKATAVTYGSSSMTAVPYTGADTDTEPGHVQAWFADNVPSGAQTVTVTRTNDATVVGAVAETVTAASACEVYNAGVVTKGGSATNTGASTSSTGTQASGEVNVDDGSPGTNSVRYGMWYTGAATPLAGGTNSTSLQTNDQTAFGVTTVRRTTAGQGALATGVATGTTDDVAAVLLAVREIPPYVSNVGWWGGGVW